MGKHDDEILNLVRTTDLTDTAVGRKVGVTRQTVSAAKRRAGLVKPKPKREIKVLTIVPAVKHQSQYGYIMLKRLEKHFNGEALTDSQRSELKSFMSSLANKVWIYERDGEGFRQITRLPMHGDNPFYN